MFSGIKNIQEWLLGKLNHSIYIFPSCLVISGWNLNSKTHSHHALQLSISVGRPLAVNIDDEWIETSAIVIRPDVPHRFKNPRSRCLILLIEPESRFAEEIMKTTALAGLPWAIPEAASIATLYDLARSFQSAPLRIEAVDQALSSFGGSSGHQAKPNSELDPRIRKSLELISARLPDWNIPAGQLAEQVGLSESRFQHLFKESVGIPLRPYLLWRRMILAAKEVSAGKSLTDCAHAAGFSDSAHFSRTFQATFGIAPSTITRFSRFIQMAVMD